MSTYQFCNAENLTAGTFVKFYGQWVKLVDIERDSSLRMAVTLVTYEGEEIRTTFHNSKELYTHQ